MLDDFALRSSWALIGFVVGAAVGFIVRQGLLMIERRTHPEREAEREKLDMWDYLRVTLGLLLLAMGVYATVITAVTSAAQHAEVECQGRANAAIATGLQQRGSASHALTLAQKQIIVAQKTLLTQTATTPEQGRAAVAAYLQALEANGAALDQVDAAQTANPFVVPNCDGGG